MKKITFEEVYANAYVRESVEILTAKLIRQYPGLRSDEDDIRQSLLTVLDRRLPLFDPEKASILRFARLSLEYGIFEIKRAYFCKKSLLRNTAFNFADPLKDVPCDVAADSSAERDETVEAVRYAVSLLSPVQQKICAMLADGEHLAGICRKLRIGFETLKYKHMPEIKRVLAENIF